MKDDFKDKEYMLKGDHQQELALEIRAIAESIESHEKGVVRLNAAQYRTIKNKLDAIREAYEDAVAYSYAYLNEKETEGR
ncbi:MAG: hypothetical protein WCP11_01570 [Candidatus Saccharibacteria bacterium]